jgi:hypothetical protein
MEESFVNCLEEVRRIILRGVMEIALEEAIEV